MIDVLFLCLTCGVLACNYKIFIYNMLENNAV